jgi:SET domain-containing protein
MSAFRIKKTHLKGQGVFALKAYKAGQLVHLMTGDRLHSNQIDIRIEAGEETCDDPLQISRKMYIDLDDVSRSFNHSCDPNCGIRNENKLIALRDIGADEEITFDYATTVPKYKSWWKMRCHCKADNCRKVVSSYNKIPAKQLAKYLALKVLPLWVRKYQIYHE